MVIRPTEEVNQEILVRKGTYLLAQTDPIVGDWVLFNEGIARRISYLWRYGEGGIVRPDYRDWGIQTSEPGYYGWYMAMGHCTFSGSLYLSVKGKYLKPTEELRPAWVWFFSRGWHGPHRGVYFQTNFKVWDAEIDAPEV